MGRQKKGIHKKSSAQLQDYKDFIANSSFSPDSTIPVQNEMLKGTSDYGDSNGRIDSSEDIKKTPLKYRISDWLKKNVFPTIITTLIVAIITAIIAHKVNLAVINTKIEYIEKRIEQIETDSVDKDVLDLKLREIVADVDSSYSITFNDIKWQLKELEEKIDSLDN